MYRSSMTFKSMLKQECGWFDDEKHAIGVLSARLSGDAGNVQAVCCSSKKLS